MKKEIITADVEIDFKEGKRTIEMVLKEPHEIIDCQEDKALMLNMINGETYTGLFKGMDGCEDIILGSLSGKNTIALKVGWLDNYFEQVSSTISSRVEFVEPITKIVRCYVIDQLKDNN